MRYSEFTFPRAEFLLGTLLRLVYHVRMNALLLAALPNPNNMPPAMAVVLALGWIAFVTVAVMYVISRVSGWILLSRRFTASGEYMVETWSWQSARLRGWCNYNNCLRIGASPQGLYLAVMQPFGFFHPPLFIPWTEIQAQPGKVFLGLFDTVLLRVGREEQVQVRLYGKMVDRLRQAAAGGWPNYAAEQMTAQWNSRPREF